MQKMFNIKPGDCGSKFQIEESSLYQKPCGRYYDPVPTFLNMSK